MNTTTRVQIPDEVIGLSYSANNPMKGMNPTLLSPLMGEKYDKLGSLASVRQLVTEKENSEFKPVKLT